MNHEESPLATAAQMDQMLEPIIETARDLTEKQEQQTREELCEVLNVVQDNPVPTKPGIVPKKPDLKDRTLIPTCENISQENLDKLFKQVTEIKSEQISAKPLSPL
ncbi:MAG: hypothetical protein K1X66_04850 [Verrucomicrobiae bacterium]|nr:hypothetical protein [Verrucomicrobiae bacterium]